MSALLRLTGALRLHTWMRPFGHALPKPSVLYSNVPYEFMELLRMTWSRKRQEQVCRDACNANRRCLWLQKLLRSSRYPFSTGRRFWEVRKQTIAKMVYTVRKWNESKGKMDVTGTKTKLLAASAAYTRTFSRAVLEVFRRAAEERRFMRQFTNSRSMGYKEMWREMQFMSAEFQIRVRDLEKAWSTFPKSQNHLKYKDVAPSSGHIGPVCKYRYK